ncbi:hypothetical protein RUM43_007051 [Polyplax serrata]|uniref:Uncharacterized protein n=1 Tax=Polyplax serrata TaxID=468196 RepID=A0AAN8PWI1_POLSC
MTNVFGGFTASDKESVGPPRSGDESRALNCEIKWTVSPNPFRQQSIKQLKTRNRYILGCIMDLLSLAVPLLNQITDTALIDGVNY